MLNTGPVGIAMRACCILRGNERRLALRLANGLFSPGVPFDWAAPKKATVARVGDAGRISAGAESETLGFAELAAATRGNATFELGCMSGPATARVSLGPIGLPTVVYTATVQSPINANGSSVFNAKRGVVPVKFTLAENGVPTCVMPPATIALSRIAGGTLGSINETDFIQASDVGSDFRIDPTSCQYVYNLGASGLGPGTYQVQINIGGSTAGTAEFSLR